MLKIDISPGESVRIGNNVLLTLEKKTGQVARLAFEADKSVPIRRIPASNDPEKKKMVGITGKMA